MVNVLHPFLAYESTNTALRIVLWVMIQSSVMYKWSESSNNIHLVSS